MKQQKKKRIGARPLIHNMLKWEGVLELQDGTRTNSQVKVQDGINLHNPKKRAISVSQMEMVWRT
jgi:hypothetical protein